jgi:hypothetical protein
VRCASAGAERPDGGLRADPAYVVIPQGGGGAAVEAVSKPEQHRPISTSYRSLEVAVCGPCPNEFEKNG